MKAIKLIAVIFLLLIALLVAAAIAVVTLIDPNDYKPQIRDAALKRAGIELDIAGEIGWSFYPWLALELNNVGVGYPEKPALGRLARAEISVSIPALLGGQLQMNRVLIDGLQLDLVQTAEGNNWTADAAVREAVAQGRVAEATAGAAQTPPAAETDSGKALAIDIEAVELRNAALTYTDQTRDSRIELSELNLTTGRVSLDRAFPLQLDFALRQFAANELQLNAQAQLASNISLNLAENHYRLDDLTSTLKLIDGAALPTALELTLAAGIDARINEQQLEITGLSLKVDPLTLSGNIKLRNFSQPELSGSLKSNSFNPKQLLTRLGQTVPKTADSKALTQASFSADLGGPAGTVLLKPLSLQLDDTRLDGEASFVLATQVITLKLKGNALDADRYLPPAAAQTSGDRGTAAKGGTDATSSSSGGNGAKTDSTGWPRDEIVPLEPLRALNLSADLDLDSLKVNDINLSKPGLSLSADRGLIRLTRFSAGVFEGQVNATARIDARKAPLQLSVSKQISGVQIGSVLQTLADTDVMAGKFNAKADLSMSGQSIHAWVNSLNGSVNISMTEGLIKGIDAAQSLCQGINNLSALWINAEQVDKTTPFADLNASFNLVNGVVSNRDLSAILDALSVAGRGTVNLPRQTLDYRLGITIEDNLFNQSCSVNNRLQGVEIPVNCTGSFHDEPAKLCRLDTSFIGNLLKAEAKRKVEEKIGTQVEDKLKKKLGEEGANVLKGLFSR
jgi:AsmA protein